MYLEEGFPLATRRRIEQKLGCIYQKMENNGNLLYFSRKHLAEFKRRYGCKENEFSCVSIYIPTLWPNVLEECPQGSLEYHYAADILPIPVDQRY